MAGSVLAAVISNAEAGSYMTFAIPVGLFCVITAILWTMFSRPHRRIPARPTLAAAAGGARAGVAQASVAGNVSGGAAAQDAPAAAAGAAGGAQQPETAAEGTEGTEST